MKKLMVIMLALMAFMVPAQFALAIDLNPNAIQREWMAQQVEQQKQNAAFKALEARPSPLVGIPQGVAKVSPKRGN